MKNLLRLSVALFSILLALPASAVQRTFVASSGVDTNPCTITSPCRGIARALTQTDPGGEVIVLDSAGYGAFTITQSVSVIAPEGVYAGISVFPGNDGIGINTAGVRVVLRGLTINGQGGNSGILFAQGEELHIENCVISNLNTGVNATAAAGRVFVKDSIVRDSATHGIVLSGTLMTASLDNVRVERNGSLGILVDNQTSVNVVRSMVANNVSDGIGAFNASSVGATRVAVEGSVLRGNGGNGFRSANDNLTADGAVRSSIVRSTVSHNSVSGIGANGVSGNPITVDVTDSLVTDNGGAGLSASGTNAFLTASRNTVTRNGTGLLQSVAGILRSRADNTVVENTTNVEGAITPLAGL